MKNFDDISAKLNTDKAFLRLDIHILNTKYLKKLSPRFTKISRNDEDKVGKEEKVETVSNLEKKLKKRGCYIKQSRTHRIYFLLPLGCLLFCLCLLCLCLGRAHPLSCLCLLCLCLGRVYLLFHLCLLCLSLGHRLLCLLYLCLSQSCLLHHLLCLCLGPSHLFYSLILVFAILVP